MGSGGADFLLRHNGMKSLPSEPPMEVAFQTDRGGDVDDTGAGAGVTAA